MAAHVQKSAERHVWALTGHKVTQVCVDPSEFRLQAWSLEASLEIRFGATCALTRNDGTSRSLDAGSPEQAAPLLSLMDLEITEIVVSRAGDLTVSFEDGTRLAVQSHAEFEAFELSGTGELEDIGYLASPGGGSPWG